MVYKCHNCGVGRTLPNFLKDQAPDLHDEYIMERYKSGTTGKGSYVPKPKFKKPVFKKQGELTKVSDLNIEHPAYKYIVGRKLDPSLFYFTDQFVLGLTLRNLLLLTSKRITLESLSLLLMQIKSGLVFKEDL